MFASESQRCPTLRYKAKEKGTDLVFLLDDSGSINDNDFLVMKVAVEEAIVSSQTINDPRYAIICFHTKSEIVCGPTENREELVKKLGTYQRKRGSTATHLGLETAFSLFVRSDVHRRLFVLTDGLPDNEAMVIEQSTKLKHKLVDVVGIGVGRGVTKDNLTKFCSLGRVHTLEQFDQLKELFKTQFDIKKEVNPFEVQLVVEAINFPVGLGEDFDLKIGIRNVGRDTIPKGTELKIIDNDYFDSVPVFFDEPVPRGQVKSQTVTVPGRGIKKASLIPEVLEIHVANSQCKIICNENAAKLYSNFYIKDFLNNLKPPLKEIPFFNILCFGVAGSGKSSFINSLLTALCSQVTNPAAVGGSSDHVTTDITRFQVSQIDGLENVPINFFDIWGMDGNNYKSKMLLDILKGELPEGYQMRERKTMTESMSLTNWKSFERRIHSVIFFMPYNIEDNPKFTTALEENFRICTTEYKMNPVVVVTRASLAGESKEQEALRNTISNKFNIPASSIYMFDNYTKEDEKTLRIDRKTLEILTRTIESCVTYQRFHRVSLLRDVEISRSSPQPNPNITTTIPTGGSSGTISRSSQPGPAPARQPAPQQAGRCPNRDCNNEVEPDWDACPFCSVDLPKAKPPSFPASPNTCHKCGSSIKETFKMCPKCKAPVPAPAPAPPPASKCHSCQEDIEADWDECPVCCAWLIRPSVCCDNQVRPMFSKCPKCKKAFPPQ